MGKKLYVANLPFAVNDESLLSHFAQAGQVESAKVITDRDTGRSRGFGFVEMGSDEEANAAINKLNGTDLLGRNITVSEARPMEPKGDRGGFGGGGGRGGRPGGGGGFGGGGRGGDRGGRGGGGGGRF